MTEHDKYPAEIRLIAPDQAHEIGGRFPARVSNAKRWQEGYGRPLATVQTFNQRTGEPTRFLDICYLKTGDGHSPRTDAWGYITTIIQ